MTAPTTSGASGAAERTREVNEPAGRFDDASIRDAWSRHAVGAAASVVALFLIVYLPDAGRGFVSDDFRWSVESRVASIGDALALFTTNSGFYRPVTSLSFAFDGALWGSRAFGYGVTNLALCLAVAASLFAVARRLAMPAPAAVLAAAVWLLNFHAVNMAVLWLSGRTALLAALFALVAVWAFFRRAGLASGLFALLAMLSKEEAIALPAVFTAVRLLDRHGRGPQRGSADGNRQAPVPVVPAWVAAFVYLGLRAQSGAFWPGDAPWFYQFSLAPAVVGRNVLEYADRAGTVFMVVAVVLALVTGLRWRDVSEGDRRVLGFAAVWIAAMYALTLFLPVRSSLYALLPSLGSALAIGALAASARRRHPARFHKAAVGLLVAAVLLVPVYWARNVRWVALAELSERTLRTLASDVGRQPAGHLVLVDAPEERINLTAAFGNHLPEALQLKVGRGWTGEIVTAPGEAAGEADLAYILRDGSLQRNSAGR